MDDIRAFVSCGYGYGYGYGYGHGYGRGGGCGNGFGYDFGNDYGYGGKPIKLPNPKYIPKPYEQMTYPGQKGQIDVKFVPSSCLVGTAVEDAKENGGYYYHQYTFIDKCSRFRYPEAFKEKNTYTSTVFLRHVVEKFP